MARETVRIEGLDDVVRRLKALGAEASKRGGPVRAGAVRVAAAVGHGFGLSPAAAKRSNAGNMPALSPDTATPARNTAPRWFGRFQLTRLLGKSERTMAWLVHDPSKGQPLMIKLKGKVEAFLK